jgi:hypothetical protein
VIRKLPSVGRLKKCAATFPVQTGGGIARKTSLKMPYCNLKA